MQQANNLIWQSEGGNLIYRVTGNNLEVEANWQLVGFKIDERGIATERETSPAFNSLFGLKYQPETEAYNYTFQVQPN